MNKCQLYLLLSSKNRLDGAIQTFWNRQTEILKCVSKKNNGREYWIANSLSQQDAAYVHNRSVQYNDYEISFMWLATDDDDDYALPCLNLIMPCFSFQSIHFAPSKTVSEKVEKNQKYILCFSLYSFHAKVCFPPEVIASYFISVQYSEKQLNNTELRYYM